MYPCPSRQENYPRFVCWCVGHELLRVRLKRRFSPEELAVPGLLTGQTVRNSEELIHSPRLFTLALHCEQLGTTLEYLLPSAIGRWGCAG